MVNIYDLSSIETETLHRIMQRSPPFDRNLFNQIASIIDDVCLHGDQAIVKHTRIWDKVELDINEILVSKDEILEAYNNVDQKLISSIEKAKKRITSFNKIIKPKDHWFEEINEGILVGEKNVPIEKVGLWIPCRRGPLLSTTLMLAVPAIVAGVKTLIMGTPPQHNSSVDSATLVAADIAGIDQIYRGNGIALIGAMTFGTKTIPAVNQVIGPGPPGILAALRYVQNYGVDTSPFLGPTECMILADDKANPFYIAVDLISEAEHGSDSASILVTSSIELAKKVKLEIEKLIDELSEPRRSYVLSVFKNYNGIIITKNVQESIEFVNKYAPEHLQIATEHPQDILSEIQNAAEILLGQYTPFSAANYAIGITAVLPTNGFAKSYSGITVRQFLKQSTISSLTEKGLKSLSDIVITLAKNEGFPNHIKAIELRKKQK